VSRELEKRSRRDWRLPRAILLLFLLGGCATVPGPPARPSTLSDLLLALDASEEAGGDPGCRTRSVAATDVLVPVELTPQGLAGRWAERWTVNRCGVLVPYVVKFDRAADGDLDVTMQREVSEGAAGRVPGATLADSILQRDTFAFLTQRDLVEAGAEARCSTRKVIATEVLAALEGGQLEGDRPIGGHWVERWTLDRCGAAVRYVVRFTTTRKGTTFVVEPQGQ